MIPIDLDGRVAIVTGAGQGLGAAIAEMLHRAGARVAITYWPDAPGENRGKAEQMADGLRERCIALAGDVRDAEGMDAMAAAVKQRFGRIDILVNNAGIVRDRSFKKMSLEEWQQVIGTNLTGAFNACKAVEPHLEAGGRIITIASISAALGFFGQANYAAAKAGVLGLTRVLARELARRRITANAIAPGLVMTEMGMTVPTEERERMLNQIPLGRFGEASDIAQAVLFLSSEMSGYITGQTIHVNGGWFPT